MRNLSFQQAIGWCGAALLLASVGCRVEDIETNYGSRSSLGSRSVNGVSVLGNMIRAAGHKVRSWQMLTPTLAKADVIVWFPSDRKAISSDVVAWLDDWLAYSYDEQTWEYQQKTLIVVGCHYDAEPMYWQSVQKRAPQGMAPQYLSRLNRSTPSRNLGALPTSLPAESGHWFTVQTPQALKPVQSFGGPWAPLADATKATVAHSSAIHPGDWLTPLLTDGAGHPLVSQGFYNNDEEYDDQESQGSRLIVIENGSFLLNASLVNHENRKLASKLVAHLGPVRQNVVFLESTSRPEIRDKDPRSGPPTGFELFRIWPIGVILAQAAALGLVYALWRFPVFGVPRRLEQPALTDFGRHVSAVGRLLASTRDRAYATDLLKRYFHEKQP